MKIKLRLLALLFLPFFFFGCQLAEDIQNEVDKLLAGYKEFREDLTNTGENESEDGKKPFNITFQGFEGTRQVITSACSKNANVHSHYYATPADAHANYSKNIQNLMFSPGSTQQPIWDLRYTHDVSRYINGNSRPNISNHSERTGLDARNGQKNMTTGTEYSKGNIDGSIVQAKCVNGALALGTTLNLRDSHEQALTYGGVQSTFVYNFKGNASVYPWKANGTGNLMLQANFDFPIYVDFGNSTGGGVYFNFFLRNKNSGQKINYVILAFGFGAAWTQEKKGILFDPTTNIVHVATAIRDESWWSTRAPSSNMVNVVTSGEKKSSDDSNWPYLYRVNINYDNLKQMLKQLENKPPENVAGINFGLNPEDWSLTSVMVQYEIEESGGDGVISGSFHDFGVFLSNHPVQ